MKNNKKNSPLNQDPKFDTTLHDYGKRAHTMTAKERGDYRTGMGHALAFTPAGRALKAVSKAAGIIGRNIGGGAHAIGQGLVRGFGTKGMKKTYDMFTNAPKQIFNKKQMEMITPELMKRNKNQIDNLRKLDKFKKGSASRKSTNPSAGKPSTYESSQQYSLPKIVEGGVELGKGDLMRRGITPGPYGGYYKKTKAGKSFRHPWSM